MPLASPCATEAFLFTLIGCIELSRGAPYLVCDDNTCLRVVKPPPEHAIQRQLWHVIPSTNSNGEITNIRLVTLELPDAAQYQDKCHLVGRVVEVGKRQKQVLLKVARPGEKPLRLTLLKSAGLEMNVGELWLCTAIRVKNTLQIEQAAILENIASGATFSSGTTSLEKDLSAKHSPGRVVVPDPTAPVREALEALVLETGVTDWELLSVQRRAEVWEWEAVNLRLEQQARVQVRS